MATRKNHIIGLVNLAILAIAAVVLGACSSYPRAFSNESPVADFSNYQTFSFAETLGTDEGKPYRSLLSQYLISEVSARLTERGFTQTDSGADIIIDLDRGEQEKVRSTGGSAFGGYYGYGRFPNRGYYGGYGSDTQITQYTESTISISFVDVATQQVVWEGISITRVTDEVRDNLAPTVKAVVAELFNRFPHFAGGDSIPAMASDAAN